VREVKSERTELPGTFVIATHRWSVQLAAEFGYADTTSELEGFVRRSKIQNGALTVQLVGSTGAITTIEYEEGALGDLRRALDAVAPVHAEYEHNARWGDGNGFSHVRSAMLKTSLTLPVVDGELILGTWQQVVAINLDNRTRERQLVAVLVGSSDGE
jgi:secondary thiamine-phosphate synthase enzyme